MLKERDTHSSSLLRIHQEIVMSKIHQLPLPTNTAKKQTGFVLSRTIPLWDIQPIKPPFKLRLID
jgi:hypothetical protein